MEFLDKNPNSRFAKLCKEYCGVKYLKNDIRDPREFVDKKKIDALGKKNKAKVLAISIIPAEDYLGLTVFDTDNNKLKVWTYKEIVEGYAVFDKNIAIPGDYNLKYELVLKDKDYEHQDFENSDNIHFEKLEPGEFRIFELERK